MNFKDYQDQAAQTAMYPRGDMAQALQYVGLGLAGEAGEVANAIKKMVRDDWGVLTNGRRDQLLYELGDVLWYVAMMARDIDVSLDEVARINLDKLQDRASRGVVKGEGDER